MSFSFLSTLRSTIVPIFNANGFANAPFALKMHLYPFTNIYPEGFEYQDFKCMEPVTAN